MNFAEKAINILIVEDELLIAKNLSQKLWFMCRFL